MDLQLGKGKGDQLFLFGGTAVVVVHPPFDKRGPDLAPLLLPAVLADIELPGGVIADALARDVLGFLKVLPVRQSIGAFLPLETHLFTCAYRLEVLVHVLLIRFKLKGDLVHLFFGVLLVEKVGKVKNLFFFFSEFSE